MRATHFTLLMAVLVLVFSMMFSVRSELPRSAIVASYNTLQPTVGQPAMCLVDEPTQILNVSSLEQCSLEQCSLEQCSLEQCSLEQCSLEQCSLEQCSLEQCSVEQCSLEQCSLICSRNQTLTGFNMKNNVACELFDYRSPLTEYIDSCLYYEKTAKPMKQQQCPPSDARVTVVPAHCCTWPAIHSGKPHFNCSVNPAQSPQPGCFRDAGQWVTCADWPKDYVAKYEEMASRVLSTRPGVAVPLLTISGWILMQRKATRGAVSFHQDWVDYRDGFGSPYGNSVYWIGLEKIYALLQRNQLKLRIEVKHRGGVFKWAEYATFVIGSEAEKYPLSSRNTGRVLELPANGGRGWLKFSTRDSDNDNNPNDNCGSLHGGWWMDWCSASMLNKDDNAIWIESGPAYFTVKYSRMLIKMY